MKLRLCAIGKRLPDWLEEGITGYAKRLPKQAALEVIAVRASKKSSVEASRAEEAERLLAKTAGSQLVVALDERGDKWSTKQLAKRMGEWRDQSFTVSFLIGGADGLDEECRKSAGCMWGLSNMTLPHGLARLLVVEQLYRGWSLLNNHPYHRE